MPDKDDPTVADAPELNETAAAIARGRELVKRARQLSERTGEQVGQAQAAVERSGEVLDRAHQLLDEIPTKPE